MSLPPSAQFCVVARINTAFSGYFLHAGVEMQEISPKERFIGMVFQNYAFYPNFDNEGNLSFFSKLRKISAEAPRDCPGCKKNYSKSYLPLAKPAEIKTVTLRLGVDELIYWSCNAGKWIPDPASFDLWTGSDFRASLYAEFEVVG